MCSAPAGRFTFTGTEAEGIVMIGGGVGITPLMAKIRYLTDLGWPGKIHLVFAVKTEADIIFRDEIDYLRRRFPNLCVTITLTRGTASGWSGERGRISAELLTRVIPQIASQRVHVCGPAEMNESMIKMLRDLGVDDERIKLESFAPAGRPTAIAAFAGADVDVATALSTTRPQMPAVVPDRSAQLL